MLHPSHSNFILILLLKIFLMFEVNDFRIKYGAIRNGGFEIIIHFLDYVIEIRILVVDFQFDPGSEIDNFLHFLLSPMSSLM